MSFKEIFYKTFYGSKTIVISVAKKEDHSYSFAIAKYLTKSKSDLESHQQFSLSEENFNHFVNLLYAQSKEEPCCICGEEENTEYSSICNTCYEYHIMGK